MWKTLLVLAAAANSFFISPSQGSPSIKISSSSSSNSESKVSADPSSISSSSNSGSSSNVHIRDENSIKKPPDFCKNQKCPKPNEVCDPCPMLCPPQECGVDITVILCPVPPKPGDSKCKPGCRCMDGFLRNSSGVCVDKDDCPSCKKPNEVYDVCPAPCPPQRCDVDPSVIRCAAPPKPGDPECKPGCRCVDGYVRNAEGLCVTRDQCPSCKKPNEVYDVCPAPCPPQRCDVDPSVIRCAAPPKPGDPECKPGCRCVDGYVRNAEGLCVTRDQCPSCKKPNEVYDVCPAPCPPQRCDVDPSVIRCAAPPKPGDPECKPGCRCVDGYVRNDEGLCVTRDQCPSCKQPNEVYDVCPAPCPPQRCDVDPRVVLCAPPPKPGDPECKPGCRCVDGYFRNDEGLCVTRDQCEPQCAKDERYEECPDNLCTPQSCSQLGFPIDCPALSNNTSCPGEPGCVCDNDKVRDDDGNCIPKDECPSCGGDPNAVTGCGINCGRRCSNYKKKNVACPLICKLNSCDCKKEYVFDDKVGKCVLPENCTPVCDENEIYSNCSNGGCGPRTCDQLGNKIGCIKMDQKNCKAGCICEEGYVKDDNGKCILKTDCPECGGDPNAVSGCGVNCGKHCSDLSKGPVSCIEICYEDACDCRKGFVLDDNTGKCVVPKECTPTCDDNEVYDACANGGCRRWNCSQQTICIDPVKCKPGCVCQNKYSRANNGTCIPEEQCESQCANDERYEECPDNLCTPQSCSQLGFPIDCPALSNNTSCPGEPGCVCDNDKVRDDDGSCIPKDECPSCGGDPNAVTGCGINCGRRCSNYKKKNVVCPLICKLNSCDCRKGYVFDDKVGKCVLPENCTPVCDKNENYSNCSNGGCGPRTCDQLEKKNGCVKMNQKCCKGGCICKEGYVKDENGKCILKSDCPPTCDVNEVYDSCANGGCRRWNCSQPEICIDPLKCKPGCVCQNKYSRAENGTCIPEEQCDKAETQCPEGEIYEECPDNLCTPQSCSQLGFPIQCPALSDNSSSECPGEPGCICDNDEVRDDDGNCIPKDQCPSCGGDPNAATGCGINCGRRCSNYKMENVVCPLICKLNGCDCKKGYVYDDNLGKCVLPKDCTPTCGINEMYDSCANGGCRRWNCSKPVICIDPLKCEPGCVCKNDYSRADNGTCIPEDQCGECFGPHEYFACGGACDNICATLNIQNQTNCPIINIKCNPMCYCKQGYARDDKNVCIPISECPGPQCADDERYEDCPGNLCTLQKCSQLGFPLNCTKNPDCPEGPGCVCDNGKVRDDEGNCIPINECPSCGGDPNAQSGCGNKCGKRCSDYNKKVVCGIGCIFNGCNCRDDFVYDDNIKKCVVPGDCTPVCSKDEVYSDCINGGCQRKNCSQLGKPAPYIKLDPKDCIKGCLCKNGYLRADNGTCIPKKQCKPTCGPNEKYDECPDALCSPQKCSQLGFPIDCIATISPASSNFTCPGKPGCICVDGYVRNKNGKCIRSKKCPSCGGDRNAVSGCGVNCGKLCSNYDKGPVPCPKICKVNACDCRKGFVLDQNINKCVRPEKCTPICGNNEVYSNCINGGCQAKNCSQLGKPVPRKKLNPKYCVKGCLCKDGYLRADNGTCILEDQCKFQCNKPHEYYLDCAPTCPSQTCASIGQTIFCPKQPPDNCKPACRCEDGYYRNENDDCVAKEECKPQCADDEQYEDCPENLCAPQKCSELGFPLNCDPVFDSKACPGGPGCICSDGNVRDNKGKCIPIDECPSCGGDPNAQSGCSNYCGNQCSDYNKTGVACTLYCLLNGCDCKDGFVYDKNIEKCVRPEDCTPICGNDEVYSDCINGGCQAKNCTQVGKPIPCVKIDPKCCIKGCLCKDDYLRADNGTCIPKDQCKFQCNKPNEYYVDCAPTCPPQTCDSIGKKYFCPKQPPDNCEPACRCEDGYYRNENGDCVTEKECGPQCADDEQYEDCPGNLCTPQKCSELGFPLNCATNPDSGKCPGGPGCICSDGNVKDDAGNCIPIDQCPSCGGDPNAQSGCSNHCGNQCSDYDKTGVACPLYCLLNGCDCKDGFVYDNNLEICVRPEDCTSVCGNDEVYSDCINGGCQAKNCSQVGKPIPCVKIDPKFCIKGCLCKDGYLRADNGTCVPEDKCKKSECGDDQTYVKCPAVLCEPLTCSEVGFPVKCLDIPDENTCPGSPECVCKNNYVKDDNGSCIPRNKCPSCGGDPNAVSGCGGNCGRRCSDYKQKKKNCPPSICGINACDCKKGFVYDDNLGKCVRPKNCTPTCKNNEVYDICANGGCDNRNCSQLGQPTLCIDPIECKGGCVCKKGYLRANNGICVAEALCPDACKKPHEKYDPCPVNCPPQTCESIGKEYPCPAIPVDTTDYCRGDCRCDDGYYRNKIGECISEKDCLECTGPNEYFSCGKACDNVCATLSKQNKTNCPIINKKCNPMCYCEDGYARDKNKVCIPIDQCNEPQCADDETYDECPGNLCQPLKCSELGFPLNCPDNIGSEECPGEPGCICDDGNVRDDKGNCIPIDQCPSCGGDPNARSGCGSNCGRRCSDYNKENVACPFLCLLNGCDCRDGFVYDDNLNTCVRPEDCTTKCGQDEIYSDCTNGGCQAKNCSQLGQSIPCKKIDPKYCIKGCLCKDGYLRADNGTCIPKDQCEPKCDKAHEYYDACAPTCPPQTCESIGKKYNCPLQPAVCTGACRCEKGYYRNIIGDCITEEECKKCSGPHEYFSCGGACDNVCAKLNKQNQTNCPIINIKCNPMCYCVEGYARNNKDVCIPIDQCPPPKCDNDQNYVKCPALLCEPLTCSQVGFPIACPVLPADDSCPGPPDCICKNNYVKDDEGNCVPRKKCPSCGDDPNAVAGCGDHCGKRCSDYKEKNKKCSLNCGFNACDCKKGFVYDDDLGKCVLPKDCNFQCGPDEIYEKNPSALCLPLTCAELGFPLKCSEPNTDDEPACICKADYVRNDRGTCVPKSKCPSCGDDSNAISGCGVKCGNTCFDYRRRGVSCPEICSLNGCDCKGGYVYDQIAKKCVKKKDCTVIHA